MVADHHLPFTHLLQARADIHARTSSESTVLGIAIKHNSHSVTNFLLAAQALSTRSTDDAGPDVILPLAVCSVLPLAAMHTHQETLGIMPFTVSQGTNLRVTAQDEIDPIAI